MSELKQFNIKENSLIARIAAWKLHSQSVAIVMGKTIHLHNASGKDFLKNPQWLRHELRHIEQFKRYGPLRFIILYLFESARNGYDNNRFEIEARLSENDTEIESRYEMIHSTSPTL